MPAAPGGIALTGHGVEMLEMIDGILTPIKGSEHRQCSLVVPSRGF